MKISKGLILNLCKIAAILILILCIVLWYNQKPNFSKYHSYVVALGYDKDLGDRRYIQLTDKQFQQIVDVYKNDKTLHYDKGSSGEYRYNIRLYKTADMTDEYDVMCTCGDNANFLRIGRIDDFLLCIHWKTWRVEQDTARQVNAIIREAIDQYESEQEA